MNHLLQILLPGTSLTHKEIASSRSTPQPAAKHPQNPGSTPRVFKGKYPGIQWKFETPTCAGGSREGEAIPGRRRKSGTARSLRVGGSEGRVSLSPHSPLPLSLPPAPERCGPAGPRGGGAGGARYLPPLRRGRGGEGRGGGEAGAARGGPAATHLAPSRPFLPPHTCPPPPPPLPQGRPVRLASLPGARTARGWAALL